MDKYTANRYIALKNQIASSGGSVPQEIIDEVNALDATVNGDETQDPPVVGLVDIVGDLEGAVEDLDVTVNGDATTTPATLGLVDLVDYLNSTVNGDPTTTPATKGIVDQLTADNDQIFQFAYDTTTQKYGYIIQNGGADTFIPFSAGGVQLSSINPNGDSNEKYLMEVGTSYHGLPCCGYSTISFYRGSSDNFSYYFVKTDETTTTEDTFTSVANSWSSPINIPSDAVSICIKRISGSGGTLYFKLIA